MPYIDPRFRKALSKVPRASTPGTLHYIISQVISRYLLERDMGPDYTLINDVMGVLACAQAEIYRRVAAPYEDQKLADHGDVYSIPIPTTGRVVDPSTISMGYGREGELIHVEEQEEEPSRSQPSEYATESGKAC